MIIFGVGVFLATSAFTTELIYKRTVDRRRDAVKTIDLKSKEKKKKEIRIQQKIKPTAIEEVVHVNANLLLAVNCALNPNLNHQNETRKEDETRINVINSIEEASTMTKPAAPLEVVVHLNAESAPILDHHLGSKEAKNEESIAEIATKVNSKEEAVSKPPQTGATASNIDEIPTGNAVKQPLEKKKTTYTREELNQITAESK